MDECVKATLDWCNEQRAIKGMEPLEDLPKGKRGNPASCPCGDATGLSVGNYLFRKSVGGKVMGNLPPLVTQFVRTFDIGGYSEYAL